VPCHRALVFAYLVFAGQLVTAVVAAGQVHVSPHAGVSAASITPVKHELQDVLRAGRESAPFASLGVTIWLNSRVGVDLEGGYGKTRSDRQANPFNNTVGPLEPIARLTTQSVALAVRATDAVAVRGGVVRSRQEGLAVLEERKAGGGMLGVVVAPFRGWLGGLQLNAMAMRFTQPEGGRGGLGWATMVGVRVAPWSWPSSTTVPRVRELTPLRVSAPSGPA
jgi:hypothetical protein